jgi:hypothetical protein
MSCEDSTKGKESCATNPLLGEKSDPIGKAPRAWYGVSMHGGLLVQFNLFFKNENREFREGSEESRNRTSDETLHNEPRQNALKCAASDSI